ncbi:MAG: IPTL-CTERM sorting domain-containing protein [Thermodesulfobacteriota bacterium]
MKILRLSILSIFIFVLSYGVSNAQSDLLIAVDDTCVSDGGSGSTLSSLYRANPQTGATSLIGPIGFNAVTGMAVLGDGRLVASARADANGERISILIEIDPRTGQGTLIGTIGNNEEGGCGRAPDLTYDAATDTLYGIGFRCVPGDGHGNITELLQINQTTGEGTTIGQTGFFGGGNGLAISAGGILFSSENIEFISINPQTGQGTLVANHPLIEFVMSAMDFHPQTGELFGIEFGFGPLPDFPTYLVTINTSNAVITRISELPFCSDALVFVSLPPSNVPTLSEWGLIAMASVLGIVGFMVARRRKATA